MHLVECTADSHLLAGRGTLLILVMVGWWLVWVGVWWYGVGWNVRIDMDGDMGEMNEVAEEVVWRVWPARERVGRAVLAVVLILLTAVVVGVYAASSGGTVLEGILWGVGAVVLFGITLSKFFFVTEFVIDEEGICAKYPLGKKYMRWVRVRRFVHRGGLGYLSTRSRGSWLDGYRGLFVRFGDDEEKLVGMIERYLEGAKSGE